MKKIYGFIILLICFSWGSVYADTYGIENFSVDVTVLENGDMLVKEVFSMNGTYNGMARDYYYENTNALEFTGELDSFFGSSIYNGSGITLKQIRAMDQGSIIDFDILGNSGTLFKQVREASNGMFGVYTESFLNGGKRYRIYNPSSKRQLFYIEYVLHDMAILHDDIAEIGWNIFSNNFLESIHHLDVKIHIPNNQEILRVWAHGPLYGESKILSSDTFQITIDGLDAHTAIDTRFVFDKSVLRSPKKMTHISALDSILTVEEKLANDANQKREEVKRLLEEEQKRKERLRYVYTGVDIVYWLFLVVFMIRVYKRHDKEYVSLFKTKYFRDFPSDYTPATVGYLMHQKITNDDLSASVLNLIYQKVITFEKLDKKDYVLHYHSEQKVLSASDKSLIKMIFGSKEVVTLSEVKKRAKKSYSSFLDYYNDWKMLCLSEAKKEDLFEKKGKIRTISVCYAFLGLFIGAIGIEYSFIFSMIVIISSMLAAIYFGSFYRRTVKGNEQYVRWKALKNFMKDFGLMDQKDLPEIVLWEKYLVYAVTLGCADQLAKTMELKIKEYPDSTYDGVYFTSFHDQMVFHHIMSTSMTSAVSIAQSAHAEAIASSSSSSGGGFGGGFSSGGGSFGGGSSGGRF